MDLAKIRKKLKKKEKQSPSPSKEEAAEKTTKAEAPKEAEKQKDQKEENKPEEKEVEEKSIRILCFHLGPEIFAFKMEDVIEIIRTYTITPIPRSPDYLYGVITLRGKILPVLNLKKKLNVPETDFIDSSTERHYKNKIIIGKGPKGPIGLYTERVLGVISVKETDLKKGPTHISEEQSRYIEAVASINNKFITLLKANEALSLEIETKGNGRKY